MERRSARFGRSRAGAVVVVLFSVAALVTPLARPAAADSLSSDRAEAAALAQKIDAEDLQVEALSNQYDAAVINLQQVQQRVIAAQRSLASDEHSLSGVRAALTVEAVDAYTSGGFAASPVASPAANLDPLVASSYFEAATGNQTDDEDQYRLAERTVATQQQQLDQTEAAANQAVSTLAARRVAAETAQQQASATLHGLNGQIATLVAQQQAQQRAALAAQQLAAYRAQVAAQQAATQAAATSADSGLTPSSSSSTSTTSTSTSTSPTSGSSPTTGQPSTTTTTPTGSGSTTSIPGLSGAAATAVSVALAQIGKPYQWGAEGPDSFDCSGLVTYAYAAAGISLEHDSAAQWSETTQIPLADAQPGDLIFFNGLSHVGIYLGNGMMVDAPHTGTFVREESIFGFGSIDGATRVT